MGKKIKILVACPSPTDGTSFYRGMGPFATLQKQFDEIEVVQGGMNSNDYTWDKLRLCDILFFQRPTIQAHLQIIEQALANHVPVWIDYDDDLLAVPKDNPTYSLYSNAQTRLTIIQCLKRANLVSVSTAHLKKTYSEFTKAIQVIPNALDDTLFARQPLMPIKDRKKVILWRGSSCHVGDLLYFKDDILTLHKEYPEWKWFFLGYDPFFITDHMAKDAVGLAPFANHMEYFHLLQTLQAPIQIVPLPRSQFNESKSNIAWIEGTLAGSAVITPSFEAWNYGGALQYGNPVDGSFYDRVKDAITGHTPLELAQTVSWETIQKGLLLTQVNHLRKKCIEKLIEFSEDHKFKQGIRSFRLAPVAQATQMSQ